MHSFRHHAMRASAVVLLLVIAMLGGQAAANSITLTSTDDTFITEYSAIGDADTPNGSATSLFAITGNGGAPAYRSYPLIQFDLTALAGQTVAGPGTFSAYVQGTNFGTPARDVTVHEILGPWSGATATFNNFSAPVGAALDTISVDYPGTGDRYVSWSIPASVIQGWINTPSSNHGLLIWNQMLNDAEDLQFGSRESANAPQLTVAVVPLPSTVWMGLVLMGGMALYQFRKRVLVGC